MASGGLKWQYIAISCSYTICGSRYSIRRLVHHLSAWVSGTVPEAHTTRQEVYVAWQDYELASRCVQTSDVYYTLMRLSPVVRRRVQCTVGPSVR